MLRAAAALYILAPLVAALRPPAAGSTPQSPSRRESIAMPDGARTAAAAPSAAAPSAAAPAEASSLAAQWALADRVRAAAVASPTSRRNLVPWRRLARELR